MLRYIVEEAVTRTIVSRDLQIFEPKLQCTLSGPALFEGVVKYQEPSAQGIDFKAYGHIIHIEKSIGSTRTILASCIVQPSEVDPDTGDLSIKAEGFSSYPKGLPWLQNWNPIAIDPFEVVEKIWDHIQSYENGNLHVTVTPTDSGTLLLPGFAFDGTELIIEFFAMFIRAIDFRDCGDEIDKLARDIPFDYLETSSWNGGRTQIDKSIVLAYPKRGVQKTALSFRFGDNVLSGKPKAESEIEWVSDVIVRGWFPGRVYSSELSNAEPDRFRRVIKEEDAKINSRERSAVWAKRKLTRRQVPAYWEEITIDMNHPNAPFGSWELGDSIYVEGVMPWEGDVKLWHRIIAYMIDEPKGQITLGLKAEGAFNYDPLEFET